MRTLIVGLGLLVWGIFLGRQAGQHEAETTWEAHQEILTKVEGWQRVVECYRGVARTTPIRTIYTAQEMCDGNSVSLNWIMPNGATNGR